MQKFTMLSGLPPEPGQSRESIALFTEDGTPFNPLTPVINGWRKENLIVDPAQAITLDDGRDWVLLGKPIPIGKTLGYIVQIGYLAVASEQPPAEFGAIVFSPIGVPSNDGNVMEFNNNDGKWTTDSGDGSTAGFISASEISDTIESYQPAVRLHIQQDATALINGTVAGSTFQIIALGLQIDVDPSVDDESTIQANLNTTFGDGVFTITSYVVDSEADHFDLSLLVGGPDAAALTDSNSGQTLETSGNTGIELHKAQTPPEGPFVFDVVTAFFSVTKPLPLD